MPFAHLSHSLSRASDSQITGSTCPFQSPLQPSPADTRAIQPTAAPMAASSTSTMLLISPVTKVTRCMEIHALSAASTGSGAAPCLSAEVCYTHAYARTRAHARPAQSTILQCPYLMFFFQFIYFCNISGKTPAYHKVKIINTL